MICDLVILTSDFSVMQLLGIWHLMEATFSLSFENCMNIRLSVIAHFVPELNEA